jgi:hypothetical protein
VLALCRSHMPATTINSASIRSIAAHHRSCLSRLDTPSISARRSRPRLAPLVAMSAKEAMHGHYVVSLGEALYGERPFLQYVGLPPLAAAGDRRSCTPFLLMPRGLQTALPTKLGSPGRRSHLGACHGPSAAATATICWRFGAALPTDFGFRSLPLVPLHASGRA